MNFNNYSNLNIDGSALLSAASVFMYRNNAFRILGIPVHATYREIERQKRELSLKIKLKHNDDTHQQKIQTAASVVDILKDPERRLVEELFWFWDSQHEFLAKSITLNINTLHDIYDDFTSHSIMDSRMSCEQKHDSAVYFHMYAIELEHAMLEDDLAEELKIRCKDSWNRAYILWKDLLGDDQLWTLVSNRIRKINDPRLKSGASRRIRKSFPNALLSVNAQFAVEYIQKNKPNYEYHLDLINASGFEKYVVDEVINIASKPFQNRIKIACAKVEKIDNSEIDHGNLIIWELILELRPLLNIIDKMFGNESIVRDNIHDTIADRMHDVVIDYGNTTEDWSECSTLLSQLYDLAVAPSLRQRIRKNLEVVSANSEWAKRFNQKNRAIEERKKKVSYLVSYIQHQCNTAKYASKNTPQNADKYTWSFILQIREPLKNLECVSNDPSEFDLIKEEVVTTIISCQSCCFQHTKNWDACKMLLLAAYDYASTPDLRNLVDKELKQLNESHESLNSISDSLDENPVGAKRGTAAYEHDGSKIYEVSVPRYQVTYPPMCACCLNEEEIKLRVSTGSEEHNRVYEFPYCRECRRHYKVHIYKRRALLFLSVVISTITMVVFGINAEMLDYIEFMIYGFLIALITLLATTPFLIPRKLGDQHACRGTAVMAIAPKSSSRRTFRFWNRLYAGIFARLNNSVVTTRKAKESLTDNSLLFGRLFVRRIGTQFGILFILLSAGFLFIDQNHSQGNAKGASDVTPIRRTDPPSRQRSSDRTPQRPQRTTGAQGGSTATQSRAALESEIETLRAQILSLETQIGNKDSQLGRLSSQINSLKTAIERYEATASRGGRINRPLYNQAIDQHNTYVNQYNELLDRRNRRYREYESQIAAVNEKIRRYNQMR